MQLALEDFRGRKHGKVFRYVNACSIKLQQFNPFGVFARAKDDAHRQRLTFPALVLGQPAEVQLHLPLVLWLEATLLEFERDQAPQLTILEKEVQVEVVAVDLDPFLAGDGGETGPEFQEKALDLSQNRVLEVLLHVSIGEIGKSRT